VSRGRFANSEGVRLGAFWGAFPLKQNAGDSSSWWRIKLGMSVMNEKDKMRFLELVSLFLLSAVPLLWYDPPGLLIGGVDFDTPLDPIRRFWERKFTWSTLYLGGSDRSMDIPGGFAYIGVQALLRWIGMDLLSLQKLNFIFWFFLTGLSMYVFVSLLIRGRSAPARVTRVTAVVFYMVNFYQLHIWMIARIGELSGAILIPVSLGYFIKALEGEVHIAKVFLVLSVFFLLGSGIGVQPPVLGVFLLSLLCYYLFHTFLAMKGLVERRLWQNALLSLAFVAFFFTVNAFWILAVANFTVQSQYASGSFESMDAVFNLRGLLEATSGRSNNFLNVIRLYGDNIWFDGYKNTPYLPFFTRYLKDPVLIGLSFLFPLLAYAALFLKRNRYVVFFTLLALGATFVGKGIHAPFGEIFFWAFKNIPGFWVYRAPWQKFGLLMMVSYSFLAAVTCGRLYELVSTAIGRFRRLPSRRFWSWAAVLVIVAVHLAYHYGFIFGRMLPTTEERKVLPGFHQDYPSYLFDAASWVNAQPGDFNVLLLPDDKANAYSWGYGGASDITVKLFSKGLVFRQYGEGMAPPNGVDRVYNVFADALYGDVTAYAAKILGLLNVRYILHRNDFLYDWDGDTDSPGFIRSRLERQQGVCFKRRFGKWDFYENHYAYPHVYGTYSVVQVIGDAGCLPRLVEMVPEEKPTYMFLGRGEKGGPRSCQEMMDLGLVLVKRLSIDGSTVETQDPGGQAAKSPEVQYERLNPTKFRVTVRAEQPFLLVLSEGYHRQWRAFLRKPGSRGHDLEGKSSLLDALLTGDLLEEIPRHISVNGYANGWVIDKIPEGNPGRQLEIILEYYPQRLFEAGVLISLLSLAFCLVFWAFSRGRNGRRG